MNIEDHPILVAQREQALVQRQYFRKRAEAGDYVGALEVLSSEDVANGILDLDGEYELSAEDLGAVLLAHWPRCDAHGHLVPEMLIYFHLAGYVSDTGRTFTGPVRIYRGNLGEDPRAGISWTVSKAKARWFASDYTLSPRGGFLGLERADQQADARPTVWSGIVGAKDILGYFGKRRESEVVVDPSTIRDIERVWQARPGVSATPSSGKS
jgi:hypothetical protein